MRHPWSEEREVGELLAVLVGSNTGEQPGAVTLPFERMPKDALVDAGGPDPVA